MRSVFFLSAVVLAFVVPVYPDRTEQDSPKLKECWQYSDRQNAFVALYADGERVLLKGSGGVLRSLRIVDGSEEWTSDLGGDISSNILEYGGRYHIVTHFSGGSDGTSKPSTYLISINKATGIANSREKIASAPPFALGISGGSIFVSGSDGTAISFAANGTRIWERSGTGTVSALPRWANDTYAYGTAEKTIRRVATPTGDLISDFATDIKPTAIAVSESGKIYFGDDLGRVMSLESDSASINWQFQTGGRIEHLLIAADRLLALSVDNFLYSFDESTGGVRWKRRLPGRGYEPLVTNRGSLVVVSQDGPAMLIDFASGKVLDSVRLKDGSRVVAAPIGGDHGLVILSLLDRVVAYGLEGCEKQKRGDG